LRDDSATRPTGDSDLSVIASTTTATVFEGAAATLTATAAGGQSPYHYRWDFNGGPADVPISNPRAASITTEALPEPGRYVFRVAATDSGGHSAADFVAVEVRDAVSATIPPLVIVGEPTTLVAAAPIGSNLATFNWQVTQGHATLDDPQAATTTLIAESAESLLVELAVTADFPGSQPVTATREYEIVAVVDLRPRVLIETNLGDITLELNGEAAPLHTANMLLYVDDGFYEGLLFHRAVCRPPGQQDCDPFVIQGGGYRRAGDEVVEVSPTREPVPAEADNGLSNAVVYSVAMALSGSDPDSGTTQFFVNLSEDNGSLDEDEFTVFGTVVAGTDVVDAIARVETESSPIIPNETSLPVEDVVIARMRRALSGE